jgi:predicted regulator of Ras-like GTPase activity (Roadblock/LC7/MglB family)
MTTYQSETSWALKELAESFPEIVLTLAASGDGLLIAAYGDRDEADRFAATVAGLQSLAQPVGQGLGIKDELRLAMLEVVGGGLFVVRAGTKAYLGVLAREGIDQGLLGHQMRDTARRMGDLLSTEARREVRSGWTDRDE